MAISFRRTPNALPKPPNAIDIPIAIETMRRRDVGSIVAIETEIFPQPWSSALYLSEIALGSSRRYFVARGSGDIVGYAGAMLVVDESHVTTIGVAPHWQRRHIATALLYRLIAESIGAGAIGITLEVRVSNTGAQRLYQRFGFVPGGIRKNYYAEPREDAIVMWAHDLDSAEYGARLTPFAMELDSSRITGYKPDVD